MYNDVYMILEYCGGGDLSQLMKHKDYSFEERDIQQYMQQIISGIKYLIENNILHRDIKPQNILLTKDNVIKIADFGFARYFKGNDMIETLCGSPLYMAPEIMRDKKYTHKADLWSVGVIMYEMLTGTLPFRSRTHYDLILEIERLNIKIPECFSISSEGEDLIKSLLIKEPEKRISWEGFFNHPWMSGKWMNVCNDMMTPLFDESDSYDDCDYKSKTNNQNEEPQESINNDIDKSKSISKNSIIHSSQNKGNLLNNSQNKGKSLNRYPNIENENNLKCKKSNAMDIPKKTNIIEDWCSKSTPVTTSTSPMFSNINNDEFIVLEMQDSDNFVDNQQQSTIRNIKEAVSYSFYILKNSCSILKLGSYK